MVFTPDSLQQMSAHDVCNLVSGLMEKVSTQSKELLYRQSKIDQLTHEMATLKRLQFGRSREQLDATQTSLLDEACDEDLAAIEQELKNLTPTPKPDKDHRSKPKRAALPDHLPRVEIHHEPDSTTCTCGCQLKRIGQDVAQKLDYTPGVFTVELHVRGKWACGQCETLIQAPVPAQVIDKGIPTAGLLAQVLVAKYADHLPLYRQEKIFGRAGLEIARSTLGAWVGMCGLQLQPLVDALKETVLSHAVVHADETPIPMLKPGNKKTHKAYLWAYAPGAFEQYTPSSTTSARPAPARMPERFWGSLMTMTVAGVALWFATITGVINRCSPKASKKPDAWRMHAESCLNCTPITAV